MTKCFCGGKTKDSHAEQRIKCKSKYEGASLQFGFDLNIQHRLKMGNIIPLESRKRQEIEGERLIFYIFLSHCARLRV